MKFVIHFVFHLIFVLVGFSLIGMLVLVLFVELLFPSVTNTDYATVEKLFFLGAMSIMLLSLFLFGWYIGKPFYHLVRWIFGLAQGVYETPNLQTMYSRDGKLKWRYRLYEELITQLNTLTDVLIQNQRERQAMETMRQEWISGITHDLKTPLTYITGYSSMLLSSRYEWSKQEKEQFYREIFHKGQHMEELIQDLNLSFQLDGRQIPLQSESLNLIEFLRRIIADVGNAPWASSYTLALNTQEEHLVVQADRKLLQRALRNLLVNSILHNPLETRIIIHCSVSSQEAQIVIEDNGNGMETETVSRLFDRYYRGTSTDANPEGSGLGMAIAQQLIAAHQGEIRVDSRVGEGTSVHITLPII